MHVPKIVPTSPERVNAGALVWSQGYRWQVIAIHVEADRHVLQVVAADAPGRDPAPAVYRDSMSLGYARPSLVSVEAGTNDSADDVAQSEIAEADALTVAHTCFASLAEMMDAQGNYRPSLHTSERNTCGHAPALRRLADLYDKHQAARGDDRRAYRY